ncbi:MAG: acyl-CoA desaturase [Gemmataceae bacterium]
MSLVSALEKFVLDSKAAAVSAATSSLSSTPEEHVPQSVAMRIAILVAVVAPFAGLVCAMISFWGWGFSWGEFSLLAGMYLATAIGITVGYHRLFSHHSFETNRVIKVILAVLGSMAVQGSLMRWVAAHRRHHQHSDKEQDPHSPHGRGRGILGMLRGLWHAHTGWLFKPEVNNLVRYVKDLRQSKTLRFVSALFPVWVLAGLLIPTALGFFFLGGWRGALLGLIWGGLVRIFFVHHVTWSVNSICHLWGGQPYKSGDMSRNNFVFGVLALGEGWHNNHHAFPTSARHGFRWWQIDFSYWIIRVLAILGLAWNVRRPGKAALAGH